MGQSNAKSRLKTEHSGNDDVKKQVDSDDSHQKAIYQLVNVKNGGGKLVDIIKSRARNSSSSSQDNLRFQRIDLKANGKDNSTNDGQQFTSKHSTFSSSFPTNHDEQLDNEIRRLVEPLLYENGRGKLIELSEIWKWRFGKTSAENDEGVDGGENEGSLVGDGGGNLWFGHSKSSKINSTSRESNRASRWVCWRLEERGFVGETALHICFLLSTQTHMIIAQKLLQLFPMLINDIYTSDEYFGESSLHMAIVNEDVRIVKLLLAHGANVHERCLGSFFMPIDQKERANIIIRRYLERKVKLIEGEHVELDLESNYYNNLVSNYDGYVYWGEYPLSFATCLGLVDCYRLLLAKGANPNKQDSNGNTSLHMAVIANKLDMFDLCYSTGANLNIANKQNLTPLTLAAKLKRVEIFFHILTLMRQVDWIFCNVGFAKFPLDRLDSVDTTTGQCHDHSVLSIVVFGASNEHLEMLNGLLSQLLMVKWETFVKEKFNTWLWCFLMMLLVASIAYTTRFKPNKQHYHLGATSTTSTNNTTNSSIIYDSYQITLNSSSEFILVCAAIYYLTWTTYRLAPSLKVKSILKALAQAPELLMFSTTCLLILCCIPMRLANLHQMEHVLASIVIFSLPLKLLFFCRASKGVGSFIVMIYKILANDVVCFFVFSIIFVAGFSQSFLIIFQTHKEAREKGETFEREKLIKFEMENNHQREILSSTSSPLPLQAMDKNYFANLFDGFISMHMMALNEFTSVFDEFDSTDYPQLARFLFSFYMLLASILLINMLIAMLGKTYQDIASQPNESVRQWARALLIVERLLSDECRLRMLDRYSHCIKLERFYHSTWPLTESHLEEINKLSKLKEENANANAKSNSIRLKPSSCL